MLSRLVIGLDEGGERDSPRYRVRKATLLEIAQRTGPKNRPVLGDWAVAETRYDVSERRKARKCRLFSEMGTTTPQGVDCVVGAAGLEPATR